MRYIRVLPLDLSQLHEQGVRKKKIHPHRNERCRKFSQDEIKTIRAEYAAFPKGLGGRVSSGEVARLATKHEITLKYLEKLLYEGLRDDEREN